MTQWEIVFRTMWGALQSAATFIGAFASLIAAIAAVWLYLQQRPKPPLASITLEAIPEYPNWYCGVLRVVNRRDVPFEAVSLTVKWPRAALIAPERPREEMEGISTADAARTISLGFEIMEAGAEIQVLKQTLSTYRRHRRFLLHIESRKPVKMSYRLSLYSRDQAARKTTISIRAVAPSHPNTPTS